MKKIKYLIFIILVVLISLPMVFAKDEVKIESYELVDNSEYTEELSKPKIDGLNIAFDLSFSKINDYAKYKITINNSTTKDYELSKDSEFNGSDYITYKYDFEKDTNIVPAKSKLTMYITITYSKEVPKDKIVNGKYIEENKMAISLSNEDASSTSQEEKNPNTSNEIMFITSALISITILSILLLIKTKQKRYITMLFISLLALPTTIFALEKLHINFTTKVTIEEKYKLIYYYETYIKESEKENYNLINELFENYEDEHGHICENGKYKIDGEKYIKCTIYTSSLHKAGDRITDNSISYNEISTRAYIDGEDIDLCHYEDNTFICEKEALQTEVYGDIKYSKSVNKDFQDNDVQVMNFKEPIYDNLNSQYPYIIFGYTNEFTMPRHDVILYAFWNVQ